MPKRRIEEGDTVSLRARVTRVDEERITVHIEGYGTPVTLGEEWIELVEKRKEPKPKDLGI